MAHTTAKALAGLALSTCAVALSTPSASADPSVVTPSDLLNCNRSTTPAAGHDAPQISGIIDTTANGATARTVTATMHYDHGEDLTRTVVGDAKTLVSWPLAADQMPVSLTMSGDGVVTTVDTSVNRSWRCTAVKTAQSASRSIIVTGLDDQGRANDVITLADGTVMTPGTPYLRDGVTSVLTNQADRGVVTSFVAAAGTTSTVDPQGWVATPDGAIGTTAVQTFDDDGQGPTTTKTTTEQLYKDVTTSTNPVVRVQVDQYLPYFVAGRYHNGALMKVNTALDKLAPGAFTLRAGLDDRADHALGYRADQAFWGSTNTKFVSISGLDVAKAGGWDKAVNAATGWMPTADIKAGDHGAVVKAWALGTGADDKHPWGANNTVAQHDLYAAPPIATRTTTRVPDGTRVISTQVPTVAPAPTWSVSTTN